ncbi:hypothetical protein GOP47_0012038 [Adiantum capillus-veneris]|uniref:Uncharacterized protein n=1 Tax=Adiantum capillus-veneris TaxID=13818 RepID=A0A9D4UTW0_ADICA|nr:hypothetical protein GOP47_0012038 [Adiantum capillus-veneris]
MTHAQDQANRVLMNHSLEVERISDSLGSLVTRLKQIDLQAWRCNGQDLVTWMNKEAEDMARVERDVAITKASGGSAAIAGGVLTGAGIVASFYTFGLAAPLAVAGLALGGAGAATSAGGDVARLSILHMKTCQIKERCKTFGQETEGLLSILLEMRQLMSELSVMCQRNNLSKVETSVIEILLRSGRSAVNLTNSGVDVYRVATIVYDITRLQKSGVIFGADYLKLVGGTITGSGLSISKSLWKGAGLALGIGFGIWDVVDAAGTLQNGGSYSLLIRNNASQISNTIKEIDNALHQLNL